jgi:hypothetical protein
MEMSERNKQIYEMRKGGMTYRAIAKEMNVGHQRVREIYLRQQQKAEISVPLKRLLSARLINAFIAAYGDERLLENPELIIKEVKLSKLKWVQNVGKKSIQELVDVMISLGFVKEGDKWIEE